MADPKILRLWHITSYKPTQIKGFKMCVANFNDMLSDAFLLGTLTKLYHKYERKYYILVKSPQIGNHLTVSYCI